MAAVRALLVLAARVVRDAAPRGGVQPGLGAGGPVHQAAVRLLEPAAPAEREQGHVVEEVEAEAAQQDALARAGGDVDVGGVGGGDVVEVVDPGQAGGAGLARGGPGGEVALGEHDGVQPVQPGAVLQPDALRAAGEAVRVGHRDRPGAVHPDGHGRRGGGDHGAEGGVQVVAVEGAGRVGVRPEGGGLGQGRPVGAVRLPAGGARSVPVRSPAGRFVDAWFVAARSVAARSVPGRVRVPVGTALGGKRLRPFVQAGTGFDGPVDPDAVVGVHGDL